MNNASVLRLCRLNVQLYFHQLHHLLLRYKITVVFALLLLSPSISAVLSFLMYPFVEYFNFATFTSMFLLQCVAVVAALIYRNVLNVREWENYLKSLPVSKTEKITADILSLLLMNAFISILILDTGIHTHANLLQIMLLFVVFITTQLSIIYKKYINTLLISTLFFSLWLVKDAHQIGVLILYYGVAAFSLYKITYHTYLNKDSTVNHATCTLQIKTTSRFYAVLGLFIKIVLAEKRAFVLFFVPCVFNTVAANYFAHLNLPVMAFHLIIFTSILLTYYMLSFLIPALITQWNIYQAYLASLPISKILLLGVIFALSFIPWFVISCINLKYLNLYDLILVIICQVMIGITQCYLKKFGGLVSLLILFMFSYLSIV